MSEEVTKDLNGGATSDLPFEIVVTQQLARIVAQLERIETEQAQLRAEQAQLRAEQAQLRVEMNERFTQVEARLVQVNAELRQLSGLSEQVNERITDLDYKVDSFIREQLNMKREITKLQEATGVKPGFVRA